MSTNDTTDTAASDEKRAEMAKALAELDRDELWEGPSGPFPFPTWMLIPLVIIIFGGGIFTAKWTNHTSTTVLLVGILDDDSETLFDEYVDDDITPEELLTALCGSEAVIIASQLARRHGETVAERTNRIISAGDPRLLPMEALSAMTRTHMLRGDAPGLASTSNTTSADIFAQVVRSAEQRVAAMRDLSRAATAADDGSDETLSEMTRGLDGSIDALDADIAVALRRLQSHYA